jgi:aryl-alcohol dehydrogenase-like predicted oxidoreductase
MEYRRVGRSGLEVSRIMLGCMSFGVGTAGSHVWALDKDESRPIFAAALEAGITTFDTANTYSNGTSEEVTGALLRELANREEIIIASKVHGRMGPGPKGHGLSRAALFSAIDASLRRLGTDYIDLYQIHRWDDETPIEETLEALDDIVRSGKVRYIGASSMWAWQFSKAQYTAKLAGYTTFTSMQDQYNLIQREEEREMHPLCQDLGVGILAWSPLARGRLGRAWGESTSRSERDAFGNALYRQAVDSDHRIIDTIGEIAAERGVSRAQIAEAWVFHNPAIDAQIVGVSRMQHLEEALGVLDITLSDSEVERLEEHYQVRLPEDF